MIDAFLKAWDLPLTPGERYVLLAMGYFADRDGNNAHPGIARLCNSTGYHERQVREYLTSLTRAGYLIREPGSGHGANNHANYTVVLECGATAPQYDNAAPQRLNTTMRRHSASILADNAAPQRLNNAALSNEQCGANGPVSDVTPLSDPGSNNPGSRTERGRSRAHAREETGLETNAASMDSLLASKYWLDIEDDYYRRRAVDPKSEWGYDQYLRRLGESSYTAQASVWRPQYRQFCQMAHRMERAS